MKRDSDIDPISARLRQEEQQAQRRILIFTLVPIAIALLLIVITGRRVADSRAELAVVQDSIRHIDEELATRLVAVQSAQRQADSLMAQVAAYEKYIEARNARAADSIKGAATRQFESAAVMPRVWLHILDERQRGPARALQRVLESNGLNVPGIELVKMGPKISEIRFFKQGDDGVALKIRDLVAEAGTRLAVKDLTARYGDSSSIQPGHYEIWLALDGR